MIFTLIAEAIAEAASCGLTARVTSRCPKTEDGQMHLGSDPAEPPMAQPVWRSLMVGSWVMTGPTFGLLDLHQ